MANLVFENMTVKYNVPESVQVGDKSTISAMVKLDKTTKEVVVNKSEPTQRTRYEHKRYSGDKNTNWSYNTELHSAILYIRLNPDEDWEATIDAHLLKAKESFITMKNDVK